MSPGRTSVDFPTGMMAGRSLCRPRHGEPQGGNRSEITGHLTPWDSIQTAVSGSREGRILAKMGISQTRRDQSALVSEHIIVAALALIDGIRR